MRIQNAIRHHTGHSSVREEPGGDALCFGEPCSMPPRNSGRQGGVTFSKKTEESRI